MNTWINTKLMPPIMKFVATPPITALKNGMLYVMPFTIVGSIFLILANLPVKSWADWMVSTGLTPYWNVAYNASFAIMALIAVAGIAYSWVQDEGFDPFPASLLAIVGLLVGWIYSAFLKHDIRIKLPEQVPANVAGSFTALIPAAVLISGSLLVYIFFDKVANSTLTESIYNAIQAPLQGITDSFGGMLAISFLVPFLWFFGVHGSTIVGGIMGPLLQANSLANQKILDSGKALTLANGGHIVTQQLLDQFMTVTGAGMTIGIVVYMAFFAKSAQFKDLGKLSLAPAVFNINEPILFATPIVMNPIMMVPFFVTPMLSAILTWTAIRVGLIPMFPGTLVPWTTPPIISGLLVGGWKTALWQALMLLMTFFTYLPFIRKQDHLNYASEQGEATK